MNQHVKQLIFVYGTLRKDANHPAHKIYLNKAVFVGYAKVRGELFMIDYYPGLVLNQTDAWVYGEVYELGDASEWQRLDVYEACSTSCAEPHEYARRKCLVKFDDGIESYAWTYVYIQSLQHFTKIASGDFIKLPL